MKPAVIIVIRGGNYEKRLVNAAAAKALRTGAEIILTREPSNTHDSNAILAAVRQHDEEHPEIHQDWPLGYVAREVAYAIAPRIDSGVRYACELLNWSSASVNAKLAELEEGEA